MEWFPLHYANELFTIIEYRSNKAEFGNRSKQKQNWMDALIPAGSEGLPAGLPPD